MHLTVLRKFLRERWPNLARSWGKLRWYTSSRGIAKLTNDIRLAIEYRGKDVQCPFCGWQGSAFYPHPEPHPRPNALCPRCYSKERHRLLYCYVEQQRIFTTSGMRVLEIGPERCWPLYFGSKPDIRYIGLDIESPRAMVHGDISLLPLPAESFDVVICYHVLEHVPDDRAAMQELQRVLAPKGVLFVQVPIKGEVTDEDPSVIDPSERLRRFGQTDHVRLYGSDFDDRLSAVGFDVTVDDFAASLPEAMMTRFGLSRDEFIYVCRLRAQER